MPNSVDHLKNRFNSFLRDGKLNSWETESLIRLTKDGGGVTNSERRQIRELFIANGDKFEPAAKERMNTFINDEIPGLLIDDNVVDNGGVGRKDLEDPKVMKDDSSLKYEWVRGELYVGGISKDDVVQGMIGNCYMVAGFASVAAQSPDLIKNAITENRDGTFTVRFFEPSWGTGPAREVKITVDGQLPTQYGGLRYGKGTDRTEMWVPILEKAFAQWKGGYDAIGNGGSAGNVMQALTGRKASYDVVSSSSNEAQLFSKIKSAIDSGKSAAAGTHGEDQKPMYTGTGIYAHHAYSITGTSEENGTKYVHLRNPWGEVEPGGNGPDDGNFKLTMAEFQKLYRSLYIS